MINSDPAFLNSLRDAMRTSDAYALVGALPQRLLSYAHRLQCLESVQARGALLGARS